jgi:hypothetical protein
MLNAMDYQGRVEAGKAVEKEILDVLRKAGVVIEEPTAEEDMQDKIDGWLVKNGKRIPIQVKFREGGDDVIFEIVKDIDRGIDGRDMVSKAELYVVMDTHNVIRLFDVAPLKRMATIVKKHVLGEMTLFPSKTSWGSNTACNVRLTIDKRHGNRKMMAYFNPKMLKSLGEWHK